MFLGRPVGLGMKISGRRGNTVGPRCHAGYASPVIGVGFEALKVMNRCQDWNCRNNDDREHKTYALFH